MEDLERATPDDFVRAVNPDGTEVDPYRAMAAVMFQRSYEKVTETQRKNSKVRLYFNMYGGVKND